jgi:glycosyltransferase involved in cell wall biosynthesis
VLCHCKEKKGHRYGNILKFRPNLINPYFQIKRILTPGKIHSVMEKIMRAKRMTAARTHHIRDSIVIYNLETNLDSFVLAAGHDWIEEFSKKYKRVFVFSTKIGAVNLPENVQVNEIGGGNWANRCRGLIRLITSLTLIWKIRGNSVVFHHMSSRSLAILGLPIRIIGVPQAIWYAHSKADFALKFGIRFSNFAVSTSSSAFPIQNSRKLVATGHGINLKRFPAMLENLPRNGTISIGRIARVKNLHVLLLAIRELPENLRKEFEPIRYIGPMGDDSNYEKVLMGIARQSNLDFRIEPPVDYKKIPSLMRSYRYCYSGTPKSVDKALLEALSVGLVPITQTHSTAILIGMTSYFSEFLEDELNTLIKQLNFYAELNESKFASIQKSVCEKVRSNCDLEKTVGLIISTFEAQL